jgi:hypothetical protein
MRLLFCLQHDGHKKYAIPKDYKLPALSFGLYLIGQGYHELKLPLDGLDGRPTLKSLNDGKAHHIVATYNVHSGMKGLYYDGKLLAHHNYPPGTKMVSGGPGQALIDNYPGNMSEAFTGTIDEVAFYDYSLTPYMVKYHFKNIQKGFNYYGLKPSTKTLPDSLSLKLPTNRTVLLDSMTGLPIKIKKLHLEK